MLIDWFTVVAQALNFVLLVWLLKHFLYKPILDAIDNREKRIAAELADAARKEAEAETERSEFRHKNEEIARQRAALLRQATDEANAERRRLLDEARTAANELSAKRQEALRSEAHNLNEAITQRMQHEVFAIAEKVLADLAATGVEERIVEVFTRRLTEMNSEARAQLADALMAASTPVRVRSAFDLPEERRATIQNALNETFSTSVAVRFETAPELVGGIELVTDGHQVGWNIANYLISLETAVGNLMEGSAPDDSLKPSRGAPPPVPGGQ